MIRRVVLLLALTGLLGTPAATSAQTGAMTTPADQTAPPLTKQSGVKQQSVAGEDDPAPKPTKVVAAAAGGVTITDFKFGPASVTINTGDSVTWTNQGPTDHTATGSGFDSGVLKAGKSYSHTFSQAGTFQYICTLHPFMKGTVVVKGASSSNGSSGSSGSSGSGSGSSSGSTATTTTTPSTPAATTNPNDLPNTGGNPFPWVALGVSLLVLGGALRWRLRPDPE